MTDEAILYYFKKELRKVTDKAFTDKIGVMEVIGMLEIEKHFLLKIFLEKISE